MSVETPDNHIEHLFPAFAAKVKATLDKVNREAAGKFNALSRFILNEGYRSQARQDWLYAQGRTRPGEKVTELKVSYHSSGLAADIVPVDRNGNVLWNASEAIWQALGHAARSNGLEWGGDWKTFKDKPHVQPPLAHRILWKVPAALFLRKLGI